MCSGHHGYPQALKLIRPHLSSRPQARTVLRMSSRKAVTGTQPSSYTHTTLYNNLRTRVSARVYSTEPLAAETKDASDDNNKNNSKHKATAKGTNNGKATPLLNALDGFNMKNLLNEDYLSPRAADDVRDVKQRRDYDPNSEPYELECKVDTRKGTVFVSGLEKTTERVVASIFPPEKQADGTMQVTNESIRKEMQYWLPEVYQGDPTTPSLRPTKLRDHYEPTYVEAAYNLPDEYYADSDDESRDDRHPEDTNPKNTVKIENGRPVSQAYFTGYAEFYDEYYKLEEILIRMGQKKYPISPPPPQLLAVNAPFLTQKMMEALIGAELRAIHYRRMIDVLNTIIKDSRYPYVLDLLMPYLKPGALDDKKVKPKVLDEKGRMYATGKRKASTARVWISRGNGKMKVNGQPASIYFKRDSERYMLVHPFLAVQQVGNFDVMATVTGGGTTGQAGAIRHGITRALYYLNPRFKGTLRAEKVREKTKLSREINLVTRDPRVVERKKSGQKKARKKFAWVKR
ncbi:hypothetical protein SARC_06142 [Sphaeroforma arctica JP610]|uniref:30S ribosomal protein S9 n=1 Tax=Sphaeroforma arctica JP610 TaxID=667725 RepID=A0A0L0FXG6_9EUKA|nr:hypothetical protein SARC_06142 [Sphaeroforma arctica JP610]KNC81535.1 hypothetical protein SARC_06142 [Sphaeroforma arctica JP610]|eukprot:XP_014155437.1 hypothetical protein SARC_06142 [Sphaeroforma arctica JP610]